MIGEKLINILDVTSTCTSGSAIRPEPVGFRRDVFQHPSAQIR